MLHLSHHLQQRQCLAWSAACRASAPPASPRTCTNPIDPVSSELCSAQALIEVDDQALFMLEGTSQDCCINGMAYGNGFTTSVPYINNFNGGNGATFQQSAFSTPDAFFTALATNASLAPVLARTIISPHIYGPNVTGAALISLTTHLSINMLGAAQTCPMLLAWALKPACAIPMHGGMQAACPYIRCSSDFCWHRSTMSAGWSTPTDVNNGLNDFIHNSFAYLGSDGYAGQRYPIWVGEFGTGLDLYNTDPAYNTLPDAYFWGEPASSNEGMLEVLVGNQKWWHADVPYHHVQRRLQM